MSYFANNYIPISTKAVKRRYGLEKYYVKIKVIKCISVNVFRLIPSTENMYFQLNLLEQAQHINAINYALRVTSNQMGGFFQYILN